MPDREPATELQLQFSTAGATPTPWAEGRQRLEKADVYWLTTVRPDGRPHVTPLVAVWLDGALYFSTGPEERKTRNLAQNSQVAVTTGCNDMQGLDVVVEGTAVRATDEALLQRLADLIAAKYDNFWSYTVRDGAFYHAGGVALVYEVVPTTAFGFGKGVPFSQTRWRF